MDAYYLKKGIYYCRKQKWGLTKTASYANILKLSGATYRGVEQLEARRAHNPEVVGSSPASATIKIPGIHYEYRDFSNFLARNENGAKSILGQFWVT